MGVAARGEEAASKILAMPEAELVALVQREDASTFERAKAIQRLGMVGGDEAVRVLAAQLGDEELNAYARSALVAIGDAAADAALREAAGKLEGRPLVGVLNSIGERRDEQAVGMLEGHLKSGDAEVRSAAAVALGEIGSEAAAKALGAALAGDLSAVPALGDACLVCADRIAGRSREAAVELYDRLIASRVAQPVRRAAMLGRVRLNPDDAAAWIGEQLASPDADSFHVALAAARELDRDDVATAMAKSLSKLTAEQQAVVVDALAERPLALPLGWLVMQTKSESPVLRAAVIDALADRGGVAATALVDVALGGGAGAPLAIERLKDVKSDDVDREIIEQAAQAEQRTNVVLIELAGARGIDELRPLAAELVSHADAGVRRAAIVALGQLGTLADLDVIIERALGEDEKDDVDAARKALRTAALRLDDREACATRVARELDMAAPETREYLLRLLREMGAGSDVALQTIVAAAKSDDAALKEAGTRELGAWPTAAAGAALLDLAKNDVEEKYRVRAMRGYIRIGRQLQLSDEERLAYFKTALEVAQRDEERRLALGILERIPSVATLEVATGYLGDDAMGSAAGETAVKIAAKLILSEPAAVAKAMSAVKGAPGVELDADTLQLAEALLKRAGSGR
jgi:HEAT repeat protein